MPLSAHARLAAAHYERASGATMRRRRWRFNFGLATIQDKLVSLLSSLCFT
jgi:hypothetical protein